MDSRELLTSAASKQVLRLGNALFLRGDDTIQYWYQAGTGAIFKGIL